MTQKLEGAQGSRGKNLDLYLTQNNIYIFVRSVSWQSTAKSIFLLWLHCGFGEGMDFVAGV